MGTKEIMFLSGQLLVVFVTKFYLQWLDLIHVRVMYAVIQVRVTVVVVYVAKSARVVRVATRVVVVYVATRVVRA